MRVRDVRPLPQQDLDTEAGVFLDRGILVVGVYLEQFRKEGKIVFFRSFKGK